jgi:hypothetical protein
MSRGRRVFHLVAGGFAMVDAIHRFFIMLFGKPQPIDFWLLGADIAIVLLILWVDVPEKLHKRRVRSGLSATGTLMQKGEEIEASAPRSGNIDIGTIPLWKQSVDEWMTKTNNFLASCSPQASAAFLHNVGGSSMRYGGIAGDAHDYFVHLLARMNNLRAIMEKPDVYF